MKNNIYPLTFAPVFRNYIWGGRNLETILGRKIPEGTIAESWDISGHPSSPTAVDVGPLAGQTLPEVLSLLGLDLVGHRSQAMLDRGKFPLLVKILDANKPLSVQVHPKDEYANLHENGELGKTEMWYILHAKPEARLIYGLKSDITPDTFRHAIASGTLETCLHELPVKAGDAIFIPAGSVHALKEGIILAEIQQNSDTTYRVYDWNRLGTDGKPRPLHIDKALDVINFAQVEPGPFIPQPIETAKGLRREFITISDHFNVEMLTFEGGNRSFQGHTDGNTFEIWGTMSGYAQVAWPGGAPVDLPTIRFTLLPATLGEFTIEVSAPSTLLRAYIPA